MSTSFRRRVAAAACLLGLGCALIFAGTLSSWIGVHGYGLLLAAFGGASVFLLRSEIGGRDQVATRVAQQVDRIMIGGAETSFFLDKLKQKIASDLQLAGQIGEADLFDRQYQPMAGTNPPKYKTRFDAFTDQVLPEIQEPLLQLHTTIAYAGAVDDHGYFPTHNRRYSRPLTGNYDVDLANNRTKRIFSDRTGSRCGSNKEPFLLQTYKRDTGEVMHDVSAPIYVRGRHWGGFRIGYKSAAGTQLVTQSAPRAAAVAAEPAKQSKAA